MVRCSPALNAAAMPIPPDCGDGCSTETEILSGAGAGGGVLAEELTPSGGGRSRARPSGPRPQKYLSGRHATAHDGVAPKVSPSASATRASPPDLGGAGRDTATGPCVQVIQQITTTTLRRWCRFVVVSRRVVEVVVGLLLLLLLQIAFNCEALRGLW